MTAQIRETLIYKGEKYNMAAEPFGSYLHINKIDLRLKVPNTALWRGYVGNWEVYDNKLFLTNIEGSGKIKNDEKFRKGRLELRGKIKQGLITPQENGHLLKKLEEECFEDIDLSLNSLFNSDEKVFASWYSGIIRCPHGELLEYVHMGYESEYEYNLFIKIENGIIVSEDKFKNSLKKTIPNSPPPPPPPMPPNLKTDNVIIEILYCKKCNNETSSKFNFCGKCGTKL